MGTGIVFDIKEFAVHDGPGIRTTIFLKGCPLSCTWCHNPEGLHREPEVVRGAAGNRMAGKEYDAEELAGLLNKQASILRDGEGGVTFSGGEPLMQAEFVAEVIDLLDKTHVLLDTSGHASEESFRLVAERSDLVYFDLKLMDKQMHQHLVGADLDPVLHNLRVLSAIGVPYVIRVPLVPGITDTNENLSLIAEAIGNLPGVLRVDLLSYNQAAGGKYQAIGKEFLPEFDETQAVNADREPFERLGLEVRVR